MLSSPSAKGPTDVPWIALWLAWALVGLILEFAALARDGVTLSELVWSTTSRYPLLALVLGILMGHWFWQRNAP